jgi:phage minor structural protein
MPFLDDAMQYVVEENIIKVDGRLFVIRMVEPFRDQSGKLLADVYAEHISSELVTEYIPALALTNVTAQQIVDAIFSGTRFTGNAVAIPGQFDFTVERQSVIWAVAHLVALADCEIRRDNFQITFRPKIGADNGNWMSYRKNMPSIKKTVDSRSVITRLYVYGKDGITIPPIESPNIGLYPRPKVGEVAFDDVEDAVELQTKGEAYLAKVDKPLTAYEAALIELKRAEGYGDTEAFELGDTVHVDEEELDITVTARIVEYEEYPWSSDRSTVKLADFLPELADRDVQLMQTRNIVNQVTTDGRLNTYWLEGAINTLQNQLRASGAYANAHVREGEGYLLENTDENSPDYGALYLGPGIFALASEKSGSGGWNWRTFGTGKGFTADEITAGVIRAEFVSIGPQTTYETGYDPSENDSALRDDLRLASPLPTSITLSSSGLRAATAADPDKYAQLDHRGLYILGGAIQIDGGLPDDQIASASGWNNKTTKLTAAGLYTGTIQANQITANSLSAISANLGSITAGSLDSVSITAGTITGAIIRTAASGARMELSSTNNLLAAYYNDQYYIAINPLYGGGPGIQFFNNGNNIGNIYMSSSSIWIGGSSSNIVLNALSTTIQGGWGQLKTPSQTLQQALDAKASVSHTHSISDIASLQSSLDAKASTSSVSAKASTSYVDSTFATNMAFDSSSRNLKLYNANGSLIASVNIPS